jgi:phospholipase C
MTMTPVSRWIALILCVLLVLGAAVPRGHGQSGAARMTPIQHVIIMMQENHSFDNYFGTYPTANGTLETPITSGLPAVNGIPKGTCLPYEATCLSPKLSSSATPPNPLEGQLAYQADYANRSAAGFADSSGPQSMVYFDYHYIPAYWDYAEEYGLADNYFAPLLSETQPNRLMLLAGATPVPSDVPPPPHTPYNETLMSQLDGAGVSWGYFDWIVTNGSWPQIHPLNFINGAPLRAVSNVHDIPRLYGYLANGTGLPAVSFVSSQGNETIDEHPPYNVTSGELWVTSVVNRVMESRYWNSTAIIITWDEGGGFFDHVVPPSEFNLTNFAPPLRGFGQRVPLLVISPFSKESYVSGTLMSHLSLVHFIEYNWRLPSLNPSVATANLPLGFFNFSQAPRLPLVLNTSGGEGEGGNSLSASVYPLPLQPLRSIAKTSTVVVATTKKTTTSSLFSSSSSSSSYSSSSTSNRTTSSGSLRSGAAAATSAWWRTNSVIEVGCAAAAALFLMTLGLLRMRKRREGEGEMI